jgi:predicted nucleic acid-binding protein
MQRKRIGAHRSAQAEANRFVTGLINPSGASAVIVDAVLDVGVTVLFSADILSALRDLSMHPRLPRFFERAAIEPQR